MSRKSRIGATVGGISIGFSTLCLLVMPVFTPSIILAPLAAIVLAPISLVLHARRTALVAAIFALVPLLGLMSAESFAEYFRTGYVAFAPLFLAVIIAALALANYKRSQRTAEPPS
jgi:hypothetical protein